MSGPPPLPQRREYSDDRATTRREQTLLDLVAQLNANPFLRGKVVTCHFAASGTFYTFRHGLGVEAACFVIRQNYDAAGGEAGPAFAEQIPVASTTDVKNELRLASDAICTVDMWFYPRVSKPLVSGRNQSL